MSEEEKVSYKEFRKLHKGRKQKEISELWAAYKEGEYTFQTEESTEETVSETPVEEKEDVTEEQVEEVQEEPEEDPCVVFNRATRRYARWSRNWSEEEKAKAKAMLVDLARKTIVEGYTCTPTDSWKLWEGPTTESLLINYTRNVAFIIDRAWWQATYSGAVHYVDRSLLANNSLIDIEKNKYRIRKRLINRYPLEGVEIKLPRSRDEYQRRSGRHE